MNLLIIVAAGGEMDPCETNYDCDFSKRLICQLVDKNISDTYKHCVRHCETDFECGDLQFCSCGYDLDDSADNGRANCVNSHTVSDAIAYCKDDREASTSFTKCFSNKELLSTSTNRTCAKSGETSTAGAICINVSTFAIHMKGCKCAEGYVSHYECKTCSTDNKCIDCINGYELGPDNDCYAVCREGLNFVECMCGSLRTKAAPNLYCNQEKSVVCGTIGCSDCSVDINKCDLCADGFLLSNEECLRKCASLTDRDCLCGSGQTFQNCPNDHPSCDTVSGKCSLRCDKNISANCQYCNTTTDKCDLCASGYGFESIEKISCIKLCDAETSTDCSCGGIENCYNKGDNFSCQDGVCIEKPRCNVDINDCQMCADRPDICTECNADRFCVKDGSYVSEDCPECYTKCDTAGCICLSNDECGKGLTCNDNLCKSCIPDCLECSTINTCDKCDDGLVFGSGKCAKKCTSLADTDCLCGSDEIFESCPYDHPACYVVSGKCSLKCSKTVSPDCQYCNTTSTACSQCSSGYGCIKDGSLSTTECETTCKKVCTPHDIRSCICYEEDVDPLVPSEMCGGEGFSCHDNRCIGCPDNCISCYIDKGSSYVCRKCASGFGFNSAANTICLKLCDSETNINCSCGGIENCYNKGDNFSCQDGVCVEKPRCNVDINDCQMCADRPDICTECNTDRFCVKNGEYTNENCSECQAKCNTADCICIENTECEKGLTCSDNKCKPCFSNCQECSSANTCDTCAPGYGLKNTTSKTECILLCNEDQRENCSCGTSGQCDIDNGFHCVNNTCEEKKVCQDELQDSCEKCWLDPNVCMQCKADRFCIINDSYTQQECTECLPKCTTDAWENCVCLNQQECPGRMACHAGGCVACTDNCNECVSELVCNTCDQGYACENGVESCQICQKVCAPDAFECLCGDSKIKCAGEQKCMQDRCTDLCTDEITEDCYCPDGLTLKEGKCVEETNSTATLIVIVVSVVLVIVIIALVLAFYLERKKKNNSENALLTDVSAELSGDSVLEVHELDEKQNKEADGAREAGSGRAM